ncbi:transposase Tan1-Aspergillus niger [Aspergillus niger]|uniref:Transposase Tan1-Aspergillus niger n=2 Tax=Aspergillus niger TaxID=5061 RepID=A2QPH4_ASPNC|nr:transposase Tan1-Aspergillus niger [Aspergillus niger]CAK39711.1 transposase Tan1-Aspergillus niger [Aspergillus niger]
MPPKASIPSKSQVEQEGRILLAIEAIQKGQITSIREAARVYDVARTTLQARLSGRVFAKNMTNARQKLSNNEEESLVKWILSLDKRGASPRPLDIRDMANLIISKRGYSTVEQVGINWAYSFVKRHESLRTRFARRLNYQRAKMEDPEVIKDWFKRVQEVIQEYGISSDDIYNFDETGFAMGMIATYKVVTSSQRAGRPSLVQPGNREWVTAIECIRSNGEVLPSTLIFKGKTHLKAWYEGQSIPPTWRFEVSDNGWTTDKIGLRWLQKHFIPLIRGKSVGKYSLLVLDGHGSHLTPEFDQSCAENEVIPICMPAHSSHLLQPLDVGCFSVLKRTYGGMVQKQMQYGRNHIDKLDFLEVYPKAHQCALSKSNIISGFRATGLVPLDPDQVLSRLHIRLKTPPTPDSQSSGSVLQTPHNIKHLLKHQKSVERLLRKRQASPTSPTNSTLRQLLKGCELAITNSIILAKENAELRASHEKQLQKRKRSRKQVIYTEGTTVEEAQRAIQEVEEVQNDEDIEVEPQSQYTETPSRAPPRCSNCFNIGHRRTQCSKPPTN